MDLEWAFSATAPEMQDAEATVTFPFSGTPGEVIGQLEERFGVEGMVRAMHTGLNYLVTPGIRRYLRGTKEQAPKTQEEIQAIFDTWMPGARRVTKDKRKAAARQVASLSPKDQLAQAIDIFRSLNDQKSVQKFTTQYEREYGELPPLSDAGEEPEASE